MRARYYDSGTGRFESEDPSRNKNNWYRYANSNPILNTDFSGEISQEETTILFHVFTNLIPGSEFAKGLLDAWNSGDSEAALRFIAESFEARGLNVWFTKYAASSIYKRPGINLMLKLVVRNRMLEELVDAGEIKDTIAGLEVAGDTVGSLIEGAVDGDIVSEVE